MSSQALLDEREVVRKTTEAVSYFLTEHCKNATIKRSDLGKRVLGEANRRTQNEVIKRTKELLKKVKILYNSSHPFDDLIR